MTTSNNFPDARTLRAHSAIARSTDPFVPFEEQLESFEECKRNITRRANAGKQTAKCAINMSKVNGDLFFKHLGYLLTPNSNPSVVNVSWERHPLEGDDDSIHKLKSKTDPDHWSLR
jgi:hypothetical protein